MSKGRKTTAFVLDGLNLTLSILIAADWSWLGARWMAGAIVLFTVARAWITLSEAYWVKDNANL